MIGNGFVILSVLPRSIGPEIYGQYSYVLSTAMFAVQSLMAGLAPAYVHFLNEPSTTKAQTAGRFWTLFMLLFGISALASVMTLTFPELKKVIWLGSLSSALIMMTITLAFARFCEERMLQFADVTGTTFRTEMFRLVSRTFLSVILIALWFLDVMTLGLFLILNLFAWAVFLLPLWPSHNATIGLPPYPWKPFLRRLFDYSWKVYVFLFAGALYTYSGRFFLARSISFEEQSDFYAGFQLGTVVLPIIAAYTALTMKEFSTHYFNNNMADLRHVFIRVNLGAIVALTAIIGLLFAGSQHIVALVFGPGFEGAVSVFRLTLVFAWLQGPGIVNSNLFSSTDRTGALSILQVITFTVGIALILCLYSIDMLGSVALAQVLVAVYLLKLVAMGILNARYLSR